MYVVPHSYPNLTKKDTNVIINCLNEEFVGYDKNTHKEISKYLKKYLMFDKIETTTSASLSLLLILKYLKLHPQQEVIISAINCWSVFNIIKLENLKPIISDVRRRDDFRSSFNQIKVKITSNTRVIIITHMFGNLIKEKTIKKLKDLYPNIIIIEDFSTSIFSKKNYKLGRYSDYAISSFGSTKPLTGGIGGLLCSHQKILSSYDLKANELLSFNNKLSKINQVLLLNQLKEFKAYQKKKYKLIKFYSKYVDIFSKNSNDLFRAITFDNPKNLINLLKENNILLDIKTSVQPNLIQELDINKQSNAFNFKDYYSLPLNIYAYRILKKKGLI